MLRPAGPRRLPRGLDDAVVALTAISDTGRSRCRHSLAWPWESTGDLYPVATT